jgi:hypothetical protein
MTQQLYTQGVKTKTNMEIKKPNAVGRYNKFMKGIDRADQ